jgi:regulator of ribonuclease activity A
LGDQLAQLAVTNGWAGVIVNGYIRDSQVINEIHIGVRALGTTPRRSIKNNKGSTGESLHFLGVTINSGSWVFADSDGVIISRSNLLL